MRPPPPPGLHHPAAAEQLEEDEPHAELHDHDSQRAQVVVQKASNATQTVTDDSDDLHEHEPYLTHTVSHPAEFSPSHDDLDWVTDLIEICEFVFHDALLFIKLWKQTDWTEVHFNPYFKAPVIIDDDPYLTTLDVDSLIFLPKILINPVKYKLKKYKFSSTRRARSTSTPKIDMKV